jgi:hypothetical protein
MSGIGDIPMIENYRDENTYIAGAATSTHAGRRAVQVAVIAGLASPIFLNIRLKCRTILNPSASFGDQTDFSSTLRPNANDGHAPTNNNDRSGVPCLDAWLSEF